MATAGAGVKDLIDAHYDSLYRYAYRLSGTAADADDLTQEAFAKALTRLVQLREPERAKAWLFRILRNAYLHRMRDHRRHRMVPLDSVGDLPEDGTDAPTQIDPLPWNSAPKVGPGGLLPLGWVIGQGSTAATCRRRTITRRDASAFACLRPWFSDWRRLTFALSTAT